MCLCVKKEQINQNNVLIRKLVTLSYSKGSNRPGYEDESVTLFNPKYYSINKLIGAC